jgi:hypothetical protein
MMLTFFTTSVVVPAACSAYRGPTILADGYTGRDVKCEASARRDQGLRRVAWGGYRIGWQS